METFIIHLKRRRKRCRPNFLEHFLNTKTLNYMLIYVESIYLIKFVFENKVLCYILRIGNIIERHLRKDRRDAKYISAIIYIIAVRV